MRGYLEKRCSRSAISKINKEKTKMFVIYYRQGGPKRFRWGQALGSFETHQAALECCEELRRQG